MFLLPSVMVLVSAQAATPAPGARRSFPRPRQRELPGAHRRGEAQWAPPPTSAPSTTRPPRRRARRWPRSRQPGADHRSEGAARSRRRAGRRSRCANSAPAAHRRRGADDEPGARRRPHRRRDRAGLDAQQLRLPAATARRSRPTTSTTALVELTDLDERHAVWEASKQSGPALKPGLVKLQGLRNGVARELGYPDYFALQVAGYDMTTDEMMRSRTTSCASCGRSTCSSTPGRNTSWRSGTACRCPSASRRIGCPTDGRRTGRPWSPRRTSTTASRAAVAEWVVKTAERFYTGMGFSRCPRASGRGRTSTRCGRRDARKKNTHASCWHMDLDRDIRRS